ncbi:membrane lipoprotein lipid attachment site-containing protein [Pelovirga terrestris]|uniref:Membrane lipoprotein lipid attachment site-containing protein n=1 Tax=Pelovirga terrestris TaxID=2771352 RepID=A0A8J6UGZ2_9BACT|nr:membrane lipoprotein lipid attachment site-containing protein [Pelovirga terrestris]MBD1400663.1 membrane lipoprotein lipid attachment site-containing protein [Pelovirga terrestris]
MKRVVFAIVVLLFLAACSSGTYNIPKREYQSRVQVLGVVPILVDSRPINYPHSDEVYDLLQLSAQNKHYLLTEQLRAKKGYFDVRALDIPADMTALSLLAGGASYDDSGRPLGYQFDPATVSALTRQNVVDALLVVVFSGEQIEENRRSRTRLESLRTTYSSIQATARVVDRDGQILWELTGADSYMAINLQYPDFDEAHFNRTNQVHVKNISVAGAERYITDDEGGASPEPSRMYAELFAKIVAAISPGLLDSLR